jgi:hypothetical protein
MPLAILLTGVLLFLPMACPQPLQTTGTTIVPVVAWYTEPVYTSGPTAPPKTIVAASAKEFEALWKGWWPKVETPEVDFKDYFAVAVWKTFGHQYGHLEVGENGDATIRGQARNPDFKSSAPISGTLAIFPRAGVKSVEGQRLSVAE